MTWPDRVDRWLGRHPAVKWAIDVVAILALGGLFLLALMGLIG